MLGEGCSPPALLIARQSCEEEPPATESAGYTGADKCQPGAASGPVSSSPACPLHNSDMLLVFPTGRYGVARSRLCLQAASCSRRSYTMSSISSTTAHQAKILADFVKAKLETARRRPMMVSMQGPQGAGKSTLASALVNLLAAVKIRCTVSSLDGECGRGAAR